MSNQYNLLLNSYFRLIYEKPFGSWDGKRALLVDKMDKFWLKMKDRDREKAISYATILYQLKIDAK